jgi:FlaA1/EpsC-like NDP-sugar epimerase
MGPKECLTCPFWHKRKIAHYYALYCAEGVIIADKSLSKEERLVIVEQCLEFNYKVYIVPLITDWEKSKEISKGKEITNWFYLNENQLF